MTAFMLAAAVAALGLIHLYRLALPPRANLARQVAGWDAARGRANRRGEKTVASGTPIDRIARRIGDELTRRGRDLTSLRQDLAITGSTMEAHLSRMLTLALAGLLAPIALLALTALVGVGIPAQFGLLAGVVLAGAMLLLSHRDLRDEATSKRAEMRRALSIYLDLVAMSLEAGRAHTEALPASARIGTGWAFTELQDATVEAPRWEGITPWAALGRLGERIGMSELVELEGTLTLAQDDGAKVKASLVARARTLRAKRVADAEAKANQATESMKFSLIVMAFAFIAYEFFPAVARLFAGG